MSVEFIHSSEELEHKIVTMHLDGWSIRSLSRHFHLGRNRVRRIVRKHCRQREEGRSAISPAPNTAVRASKLDAYGEQMSQLLEQYPDISAVRMREELAIAGYDGGITILRERLARLRPQPKREPVVRFETEPGIQAQMDWSPYTIDFKRSGKQTVLCFSYILGFSRRQYIDFVFHRDFYTLIRRHVDAFAHFGGVARQCLYDNEKTIVLRWEAGRPVFNPAFIGFITHYQCMPVACRQGRAQTKGKIERPFQYVEGNLLNARTFLDIEDLRGCARWWLAEKSDTHPHETTGRPPLELFLAEEKSRLIALPAHAYDCGQVALRVCSLDGFLEFETNRYSVPYEYVGDILALKATEHEIVIYNPYIEIIATHQRHGTGQALSCEEPLHRKSKAVRYGLEPVRDAFERIGEAAKSFLVGLQSKHPHHCGFHARRILMLKERYNADDIDRACLRSCRYHAYDADAIKRILEAQATPRSLESVRNESARTKLENTLPPIKQRSLLEYAHLLGKDNPDDNEGQDDGKNPRPSQDAAASEDGQRTG
jgi:transposase